MVFVPKPKAEHQHDVVTREKQKIQPVNQSNFIYIGPLQSQNAFQSALHVI